MSHHGGHHTSHHGGHHMSHHGGHHTSHHGGHHMSHHGSHNLSHHGGHHMPHHGSHHMSHHGGNYMPHHESHHMSYHGGHHMSHHGDHNMSHHGGHHMSHHRGHHTSHHKDNHNSHHGGHHTVQYGSNHMTQHGGCHKSHHKGSYHGSHHHMSHHGHYGKTHHGGSHKPHHGSHHKKEVSFSKYVSHGHDNHHGGFKADGLFDVNEKEIMQLLNERLSSYLGEVRSLEMANAKLERKICEWYENNPPKTPPDGTQYFRIIDELQNQIMEGTLENANTMLQIDNARLAAADYRSRYEAELTQSNNAQMDVNNLARVLDGLNEENSELEMQVQSLEEEKNSLQMNSEEEIESLLSQLGARINIELNAAPSIDLNEALSEIREEYENLMERNLREAEDLFLEMSGELSREVASSSQELQSVNTELIELKRCVQALEIDLQSELSLKSALEGTLAETEAIFGSKLAELQCLINNMESELATILSNLERQNYEYKVLMDQKTHLEMEIATYKRLLDGHDIDISEHGMSHGNYDHHVGSYNILKHQSGSYHSSGGHHWGHHSSRHHTGGHISSGGHHKGHNTSGHHSEGPHSSGGHHGGHHPSGHHSGEHHSSCGHHESHNSSGHHSSDQ
ncbi:hypothetical protein GDO81_013227 [Engystomops pustulosus]|uniref:IF rod domain-containing protein n=1 Tax=Engystomops pustulosus TaxID=76066 RepID=A0AAV7B2W7_ENGPU|nr:hypothetical protein GDO81_013227 [Engystomops pustulosus]